MIEWCVSGQTCDVIDSHSVFYSDTFDGHFRGKRGSLWHERNERNEGRKGCQVFLKQSAKHQKKTPQANRTNPMGILFSFFVLSLFETFSFCLCLTKWNWCGGGQDSLHHLFLSLFFFFCLLHFFVCLFVSRPLKFISLKLVHSFLHAAVIMVNINLYFLITPFFLVTYRKKLYFFLH
jgi:hypothetical protein